MSDMFIANGVKNQLNAQSWGASSASEDYVLDLFTNNVTVSDTTVSSNLTAGSWTGYAQVSVPRSTLTTTLSGNVSYIATPIGPTWTNGSGASVNVYGWFLRGASSGNLYASQNFTSPPVAIPAGYSLVLNPFQIALKSF